MMRKLMLGVLAVSTCGSVLAATRSVSGDVNFKVTVPEVLVLYHWDEAHLNFNNFKHAYNTNQTVDLNKDFGDTSYIVDASTQVETNEVPQGFGSSNLIGVTLQNSWAVRSLSSDDVSLEIEVQDGTLKKDNDSHAVVSNPSVSFTGVNSSTGTTIDLSPGWEPKIGDITFNLDLSGVTKPGEHSSEQNTFTLTLTGN